MTDDSTADSTLPAHDIVVLSPPSTIVDAGDAPQLHRLEDVLALPSPPLGLYLAGWSAVDAETIVARWRVSEHWFRPIFVRTGDAVAPASDGSADLASAVQACRRIEAMRRGLALEPSSLHADERVLYHLYLRDPQELVPLCDRHHKFLYRYPVVEALGGAGEDTGEWLGALVRRRLLEPARLVDRTRHCRRCHGAHLHFLDVCPQCSSIQIARAEALHCFTCGHVAPEADFLVDGALTCPQCSARLRHIGVDYDRPLTRYACGSCHHAFVEATVVSRCLDCGAQAAPDELDVREVSALRLSGHGRAALRAGQISESFAALDTANHVVPNYFRTVLDWALATQARHAELRFALVVIDFVNAAEVIEALGASRTYLMLDELARRLREIMRASDLTTRTSDRVLWFLLPFSQGSGFAARVQRLLQEVAPPGAPLTLRAQVQVVQTPEEVTAGESAAALMARLESAARG